MIQIIASVLSIIPIKFRARLGWCLGYLFSLFPGREKKIVQIQMNAFLGAEAARKYSNEVFANAGQTVLECMNLMPYLNSIDDYVVCADWDIAEKLKSGGKPIVTLTAHTSNWDLLAAYSIKKGFNVATIAKKAKNQKFQNLLERIRSGYGIKTIWRDDPGTTREIIKCLRSGSVLAALIDQDLSSEGVYAPFFSMPAKYPAGLISLAQKCGAEIIAAFILREEAFKYRIYLHKLDSAGKIEEILAEYSRLLEKYIRLKPAQWVWFHKRWRSLEGGKRLSSREYMDYLNSYEFKKSYTEKPGGRA